MYGQSILGIDLTLSRRYKEALYAGHELLRMGYTRFNFNYFQSDEDIEYVLSAIEFVCKYGWMFLPSYKFDVDLGIWVHRTESEQQTRVWLGEIDYSQGKMGARSIGVRSKMPFETTENVSSLADYFEQAKEHLLQTIETHKLAFGKSFVDQKLLVPEEYQDLIWFLFPSEIVGELLKIKKGASFSSIEALAEQSLQTEEFKTPFIPKDYNKNTYAFKFSRDIMGNEGDNDSTQDSQLSSEIHQPFVKPIIDEPIQACQEIAEQDSAEETKIETQNEDNNEDEEEFAFNDYGDEQEQP